MVYLRFVLVLYLFTMGLLFFCSLSLLIKILLFCLLLIQFREDFYNQSPYPSIQEIRCSKTGWILVTKKGALKQYDTASILIHNTLFQLIELSHKKTKKLIVLFNDQIPKSQLRFIHIKTAAK